MILKKNPRLQKVIKRTESFCDNAAEIESDSILYGIQETRNSKSIPVIALEKELDLKLDGGSYLTRFTADGRFLLIAGSKGHVSGLNWQTKNLRFEQNFNEMIYDATWLQNETMFAVAQKKYTFIYDHHGAELHRLKKHTDVRHLEYLRHHYLLATSSLGNILRYHDISTGILTTEMNTKNGAAVCMKQNSQNGVINLGHASGTVTFWSPATQIPLAKMYCHKGPVSAMAVDFEGMLMATAGSDGQIKLWDLRNFSKSHVFNLSMPASSLDFSQKGYLVAGYSNRLSIWRSDDFETKRPSTGFKLGNCTVKETRFCPFEDYLGIGHSSGAKIIMAANSCIEAFDSSEINLYATKKQRQELEVRSLLDKLAPETIQLDTSTILEINKKEAEIQEQEPIKRKRPRAGISALDRFIRNE